jgi:amino acid permease
VDLAVAAVAAVAYAGHKKLDIFISFVESFACTPLLFIFPPLFHIKAFPGQALWRKIADIALILFGFLVFVYTLVKGRRVDDTVDLEKKDFSLFGSLNTCGL